jgi:hypothetical protein
LSPSNQVAFVSGRRTRSEVFGGVTDTPQIPFELLDHVVAQEFRPISISDSLTTFSDPKTLTSQRMEPVVDPDASSTRILL